MCRVVELVKFFIRHKNFSLLHLQQTLKMTANLMDVNLYVIQSNTMPLEISRQCVFQTFTQPCWVTVVEG